MSLCLSVWVSLSVSISESVYIHAQKEILKYGAFPQWI